MWVRLFANIKQKQRKVSFFEKYLGRTAGGGKMAHSCRFSAQIAVAALD
jgi:hypothetical protein